MNRAMKTIFAAVGWLIGAFCIFPAVLSASGVPAIIIQDASYNFGELAETIPVERDFILKNGGKATLNIKDVRPS